MESLRKNLLGIEEKVAKLMSASVTVGADGGHNIQIDSVDKSNLLIDKSAPGLPQKSRYEMQTQNTPQSEKGKAADIQQP